MKTDILSNHRADLVDRQQFFLFLEKLQAEVREAQLPELEYELSGIVTTYNALLDYYIQGADDPERNRVYHRLVGRALLLSDRCAISRYGAMQMPYYTGQCRTAKREPLRTYQMQLETFAEGVGATHDMEQLRQLATAHDKHLSSLFAHLWTQDAWDSTMASEADGLLLSPAVTVEDQCTIVSAVTMNLLRMFDPLKMLFLCDAYYHPQALVNTRALVGIVLVCYCWTNRIRWYSEVKARLSLLNEDPVFGAQVSEVVLQMIRSTGTEEINRKMREEIIPELMKNPKLRQVPGVGKEDLSADDISPDWERWMHESGLEESLREITEWQMEGADVNMSTFSQLKRYPFFYDMVGWFRPFDAWQADVLYVVGNPNEKSNPLASTILQSGYLCDSDKYSFCYAIREIPQMQREAMMAQLDEQNRALKESADMPDLKRLSRQTAQSLMRQYVQNLYRFFKLFPNVQEFDNPFELVVQCPQSGNPLYTNLVDPEHLLKLVGFYIKQKNYEMSVKFFDCLEERCSDMMGAVQLQQKGLCLQKLRKYKQAINAYTRADLLQPGSYWTILHLAQCYAALDDVEEAVKYYGMAAEMKPDNLSLNFHMAELLCDLGQYEEALPHLHKIDYHHPESVKNVRLLAECNFFLGKHKQSARFYERMMADCIEEIIPADLHYAACNYWLLGERERCFNCLQRAEELYGEVEDGSSFTADFLSDMEVLERFSNYQGEATYLFDAYNRYKMTFKN